jgi:hypothetical protein
MLRCSAASAGKSSYGGQVGPPMVKEGINAFQIHAMESVMKKQTGAREAAMHTDIAGKRR